MRAPVRETDAGDVAQARDMVAAARKKQKGLWLHVTDADWDRAVGSGQAHRCSFEDVTNRLLNGELPISQACFGR